VAAFLAQERDARFWQAFARENVPPEGRQTDVAGSPPRQIASFARSP